jgi:hypothetical protein
MIVAVAGCSSDAKPNFGDVTPLGGSAGSSSGGAFATGGAQMTGSGGATVGSGGVVAGGAPGTGGSIGATGGVIGASGGNGAGGAGGLAGTGGAAGVGGGASGSAGMAGAGGTFGSGGAGASGGRAGASSGGTAGKGGASGKGGSGNNGPPPSVEQLFPLAVGNVWNYRVTILPGSTGTSPCPAGMHATTITGQAMFMGQNAFTATHACAPSATRYYVENAMGLEVSLGTAWSVVLPRPISDGAVFMSASSSEVIAHVADVTVPAGTFSNCWATEYVSATGPITTYCAGVGLVSLEYDAPNGGGYALELVSYMLK